MELLQLISYVVVIVEANPTPASTVRPMNELLLLLLLLPALPAGFPRLALRQQQQDLLRLSPRTLLL